MPKRTKALTGPDLKTLARLHGITNVRLAKHMDRHEDYVGGLLKGKWLRGGGRVYYPSQDVLSRIKNAILELAAEKPVAKTK